MFNRNFGSCSLHGLYSLHWLPMEPRDVPPVEQHALKMDGNIPFPTRFDFYFCPFVSIFVGSYFHIYGSRNKISPFVSEKSRFYMELTRIYFVFHPVFNLHKICLKIDMFKNIPITKYACTCHSSEYWTNNFVRVYYFVTLLMYTREYLIVLFFPAQCSYWFVSVFPCNYPYFPNLIMFPSKI